MRARQPDVVETVGRDGVRIGYEVFGDGPVTVLLLPTWTIIHSRFWKMQVPYLARRYRVITYDGPGNGRSDRTTDPDRYTPEAHAADAIAVLDACGVDQAVIVGLSMGGQYGTTLASLHPERAAGLVMVGPALPLVPPSPGRASIGQNFRKPYRAGATGWEQYNLAFWHDHWSTFAEFFFSQAFSEPHSTKAREDAVGWALETTPDVLEAEASNASSPRDGSTVTVSSPEEARRAWAARLEGLACPVLVVHGTGDRIQPHEAGVEAARLTGGTLISFEGSGHLPNVRDPVRFNLVLRDFVESLRS